MLIKSIRCRICGREFEESFKQLLYHKHTIFEIVTEYRTYEFQLKAQIKKNDRKL